MRVMRSFILTLMLFLGLIQCQCLALASVDNNANSVTLVTVERPPYTSDEKNRQGFLTDIVESAFQKEGYRVKRHTLPWARAKLLVMSGEADAIYPASYEDTFDMNGERVLLYNTLPIVLVKHISSEDRWNGDLSSLKGRSIASHRGIHFSQEYSVLKDVDKIDVGSTEQLFNLVKRKRVDFAITDELTANYMLSKPAYRDLVVLSPPYIASSELYLGISSLDENANDMQAAFERGLANIKASGEYQAILSAYRIEEKVRLLSDETKRFTPLEPSTLRDLKGSGLLPTQERASVSEMQIAVIGFNWETDSYQQTYRDQLEALAAQKGVNLSIYDAQGSIEQQIELVRQVVQSKPDVIALWPVHGEKIEPALQFAYQQNIPVFLINTPVTESLWQYVRGYIGPDNYQEGVLAAKMMHEALGNKGRVLEIQGFPGYKTAVLRSLGFHQYLKDMRQQNSEFDIEVVDVAAGYWSRDKAYQAMQRLLRRHDNFDGLYIADDNMAIGAISALKEVEWSKEYSPKITSATLFGEGYDAIKKGDIWRSVWQSPKEEATLTIDTLILYLRGEDVPLLTFLPIKPVTKDKVDDIQRPMF